jgi:hypothetical protein
MKPSDYENKSKAFDDYLAAEGDLDNIKRALIPYAFAAAKAEGMQVAGYRLDDMSGNVCISSSASCEPVDSMIAYFLLADPKNKAALGPRFTAVPLKASMATKPQEPLKNPDGGPSCPPGPSCSICISGFNLCTFYDWAKDKPIDNSPLKFINELRDSVIPPENNGEISKWIRDPGKTTLKAIQDVRDHWISPRNNGELAKVARDPIKCTIGRFFHKC